MNIFLYYSIVNKSISPSLSLSTLTSIQFCVIIVSQACCLHTCFLYFVTLFYSLEQFYTCFLNTFFPVVHGPVQVPLLSTYGIIFLHFLYKTIDML